MCLRGLGARTKDGAVLLTAATCGGAVVPPIMNPVTSARGVQYGFCVIVAVFAFGSILPLYTAVVPAAKEQVDPVRTNGDSSNTADGTTAPTAIRGFRRKKRSSDLPAIEQVE